MFGWLTHGGRHNGAPTGERANGAPPPEDAVAKLDPVSWNDEVARFTTKRIDSYGPLFHEMSGCRSPLEFAQLQQRWWSNTVQDYAGFVAGVFKQPSQARHAPSDAAAGREADHPSPEAGPHPSPSEE